MLTTDGVHGVLEREQLADLLGAADDPETIAESVDAAATGLSTPSE